MPPQYKKVRPAFQKIYLKSLYLKQYILCHPSVPLAPKPVQKFCQAAPYRKTDNPKIFFYFGAPFFPAGFLNWSVNCWVRGFLPYTCRTNGGDGEGGEVGRRRHQYELLLSAFLSMLEYFAPKILIWSVPGFDVSKRCEFFCTHIISATTPTSL